MDRRKYPVTAEEYQLLEEIGQGVSASVHRALCIPSDEIVPIKILDFERYNSDLCNISREAQTMILIDHPNVLKAHCSFVNDHNLWVVMPFMSGGSCLHILKAAYPDGFEEVVLATILPEVLEYLHHDGHIHRDVKVVMPFMAGGSSLHILKAAYPDGFEEVVLATILCEVLEYLHHHGHIHRDVKEVDCN